MKLMNNVVDTMDFPDERFKINSRYYRPVGVGIMGVADAMFMLNYRYDCVDGRNFASNVMKTITTACVECSSDLEGTFADGSVNGFPIYDDFKKDVERIIWEHIDHNEKVMEKVRKNGVRNNQFTTAMPTGTTALSCDASYGIEPCFGLVFQKNYIDGSTAIIANRIFEDKFKDEQWYTDDLLEKIFKNGGSLKGIRGIPKEVREVFVTAHDIKYKDRIDMQSEIQKYCSTAISSCISPDSLIDTNEGLFYFDEMDDLDGLDEDTFRNNLNFSGKVLNHNKKRVDITSFYNNGIKQLYKLKLKNGLTIKCTDNEKFKFLDEENDEILWKELKYINHGDRIMIK